MKRKAIEELIKWKEHDNRIPILLSGAKGVGKTYLAYDFAKAFFEHIYYVNLEHNSLLKTKLSMKKEEEAIELLEQHLQTKGQEDGRSDILIIDEVSYLEDMIDLIHLPLITQRFPYILCITSNPLSDRRTSGFSRLQIHPLEFDEFLRATANDWYIDLIYTHFKSNRKLPDIVHKELLDLFALYLRIGGMPSSVNEYLNYASELNVSEQQRIQIGSMHDGIIRKYEESDSLKMIQVMNSIIHQLMKENKKFQYKLIRKGTTFTMYKEAIKNLTDLNYIIKSNRINQEHLSSPVEFEKYLNIDAEDSNTYFKLYLSDTGLLHCKMEDEYDSTLQHRFDKSLLENYVAQSLLAKQYLFAFWESESIAKIDFIIEKEEQLIPIEIHPDCNTRSKSLSVLKQKYDFPYAIKMSAKNFDIVNHIKYIPYYAFFCL